VDAETPDLIAPRSSTPLFFSVWKIERRAHEAFRYTTVWQPFLGLTLFGLWPSIVRASQSHSIRFPKSNHDQEALTLNVRF
jgi:hypothetical protein